MNISAPEEIELEKKLCVLERLKEKLAFREEAMTELRAELEQFEANYTMEVGRLYAELDEIEAQIAEEELKLVPDDEELRKRAEESAANADEENWKGCINKWQPTAEAKKAYHKLAKLIHPDLAFGAEEKAKRHDLMAKLNDAYSAGDQNRLNKLVEDFRDSPDLISSDSIGDKFVRAIRQIYQIKTRLKELREEKLIVELSELFILREKFDAEMLEGRNMLKQMAERTKTHIKKSQRRLSTLQNLNQAQEEYVKDRFGMDISAFR
ncbi:hypothetical protein BH20ACI1_BH20ACI1_14050 [soil metagenome]